MNWFIISVDIVGTRCHWDANIDSNTKVKWIQTKHCMSPDNLSGENTSANLNIYHQNLKLHELDLQMPGKTEVITVKNIWPMSVIMRNLKLIYQRFCTWKVYHKSLAWKFFKSMTLIWRHSWGKLLHWNLYPLLVTMPSDELANMHPQKLRTLLYKGTVHVNCYLLKWPPAPGDVPVACIAQINSPI